MMENKEEEKLLSFLKLCEIELQKDQKDQKDTKNDEKDEEKLDIKNLVQFLLLCGKLKSLKRTGWVNNGIKEPETVASHSFGVAMLGMVLVNHANRELDPLKLILLALVHDLAECLVGDITPSDGISNGEKHLMEKDAMQTICKKLKTIYTGSDIFSLWMEYEENMSPESRFCKQLDKLDMLIQAFQYEKDQNLCLEDFFSSTKDTFSDKCLVDIVDYLLQSRRKKLKYPRC